MVSKSFSTWFNKNEAAHTMEWAIITDKLALGINGVEWLALELHPDKSRQEALRRWNEVLSDLAVQNPIAMMGDALLMDSDSFYTKHGFNWWLAVKSTLTYLSLLRQRDYNHYSDFIQQLEQKGNAHE